MDQSDVFVGVSSDWEIIDGLVSQDSVSIDNVSGSEGNTSVVTVFDEGSVVS